jgi:MHS family proline/betaine transporter-like MFS transporter
VAAQGAAANPCSGRTTAIAIASNHYVLHDLGLSVRNDSENSWLRLTLVKPPVSGPAPQYEHVMRPGDHAQDTELAEPLARVSAAQGRLSVTALSAGAGGNLLEWYDFGIYGLLAPVLAAVFFPAEDLIASLIGAYSLFAVGFAMRPIGGIVLGHLGDQLGRRFVLIYSIVLMGLATTAIAFLPGYRTIGVSAPLLLLLLRVVQGFSVGGEFTGSVNYLVETAPQHRRGLAGSFANFGSTAGMLLAAAVAAATVTLANPEQLQGWAWRVPFLLGGFFAAGGYFLRKRLREPGYQPPPARADDPLPLRQAITLAPRAMLAAVLFASGYGIVNYLTMVFLPVYASEFGRIAEISALQLNTAAQAVALLVVPLAGWLTDHLLRRRTLLITVFMAEAAVAWACFTLAGTGGVAGYALAQITFGILLALVMGAAPAMLVELFPSAYRMSGYSVSFNIGIGIAGGTAPVIATTLIGATGSIMTPAWFLIIGAMLAAAAVSVMKDRSRDPLR